MLQEQDTLYSQGKYAEFHHYGFPIFEPPTTGRPGVCGCWPPLHGAPGQLQVLRPQRGDRRQGGRERWRQEEVGWPRRSWATIEMRQGRKRRPRRCWENKHCVSFLSFSSVVRAKNSDPGLPDLSSVDLTQKMPLPLL